MHLAASLDLDTDEVVAFVGAGGKKTAMHRLVAEAGDRRVGYTSTTHMPPPATIPLVLAPPEELVEVLRSRGAPLSFAHRPVRDPERVTEKVRGYEPAVLDQLVAAELFDWLLVKADGARQRSFKAPGRDEPAIPFSSTVVVVFASVDIVGLPLTEERVHRPERVARLAGISVGEEVQAETVARVLSNEQGGLKGIPDHARPYVVINQADTGDTQAIAEAVIEEVRDRTGRFEKALVTSFHRDYLEEHTV